jgi:hypothetical protein
MQPEGSLPCSQEPTTALCCEPDESSLQHPSLFLYGQFKHYPPTYAKDFLVVYLVLDFPPKFYVHSSSPIPATWPTYFILLNLIILIILYEEYKLWRSSLCRFSSIPSCNPPLAQTFSSASCFQTPSVCVLPLMSVTKFQASIKLILYFSIF